MRRPLTFAYRNVLFGRDFQDAWALFRVRTHSYADLPASTKHELLGALAGFAYTAGNDFQLLRVSRDWSTETYVAGATALRDERYVQRSEFAAHLDLHRVVLDARRVARPELFLAVRLDADAGPRSTPFERLLGDAGQALRQLLGLQDPRALGDDALEAVLAQEDRAFARVTDFLDCDRVTTDELQWLVRRAFCRGLSEPLVDELWQPQALVFDGEDEGRHRYVPLEADILRLMDAPVRVDGRAVQIEDERGTSHQAMLVLGALPEVVTFPGRQAELLFAPLEALPFPVDASVCIRWIANDRALTLTRRKLIDADHAFDEESHGDHGPTSSGAERPAAARELEDYLTASDRPPLLRTLIALAVGATSVGELDRRVELLRREYAPVMLHRPLGAQLELFVSHLPAQVAAVRGYDDVLLCEQLGAMVPSATHAVGSEPGFYIGRTLSGSAQPVLFDPTEGPRTSRPPAVLCSGTLGSGKTVTALLIAYTAFLAGSRIVTVDPKGDHQLDRLIGPGDVERIELTARPEDRGLLDPLRIGSDDTRADLAYSFLTDVLPAPVPPRWQTELRCAVDVVAAGPEPGCGRVLDELERGGEDAREAARALRVHSAGGLLQLAFAQPEQGRRAPGAAPVTCLRIANLTLPIPGTPRAELTSEERSGQALLRLLATYALHLMGSDWSRHKVLVFDEAWMLLGDAAGRALIQRANRLCRSQNATPILATQALADVAELDTLLGALFCFGVESDREASDTLQLLGLDAEDPRLRSRLRGFRQGACYMRDYTGRVAAIQVDPVDPALLEALDTRPSSTSTP